MTCFSLGRDAPQSTGAKLTLEGEGENSDIGLQVWVLNIELNYTSLLFDNTVQGLDRAQVEIKHV